MAGDEAGTFGALLRRYRQAAALSQEALAERAGISAVAVSALERGARRAPHLGTVDLLATALALEAAPRAALLAAARPADAAGGATAEAQPSIAPTARPEPARTGSTAEGAALAPDGLPAVPTPLIGRQGALAAVVGLLVDDPHAGDGAAAGTRLLTLTGPGGVGKTRMALQAARAAREHFADGVVFVDLAPLQDGSLVAATIARGLGVAERGGTPLRDTLVAHLRPRQLLLLLDNAEQVLAAVADEAAALHAACPGVRMLVTSRAALHLRGEQLYPVPPLAVPEPGSERSPAALVAVPAVALFVQRARALRPDFTLGPHNAEAVAAICRRLDGLPLAIELAAARVGVLSVGQLLARLDQALSVLTGGARDLPARQQTLRATLEWSTALLGAAERALFARLGVFVGGAALEAVEAVCATPGEHDILTGLGALVELSLLRLVEVEPPRYRMLETVHEYARECLSTSGEGEAMQRAHAAYYLTLAEEANAALQQPEQADWLGRLEAEHGNLRTAVRWSVQGGDTAIGLLLVIALRKFWGIHGHIREGRRWLAAALLAAGPYAAPSQRADALRGAGSLAWLQGDLGEAMELLSDGLTLYRGMRDMLGVADTISNLAIVAGLQANYAQANAWYEEGLALHRGLGVPHEVVRTLMNMGSLAATQGDYARAHGRYEEALALARSAGNRHAVATLLCNLGWLLHIQGEEQSAGTVLRESLSLSREVGDKRAQAAALQQLGALAREQGEYRQAGALLEECIVLTRAMGDKRRLADGLAELGHVAADEQAYARAYALFTESVALNRELDDRQNVADLLERLAGLAGARGQGRLAGRLWGTAAAMRADLGAPLAPGQQARHDHAVASVRAAYGEADFAAAWAEGEALPLEQAVAEALSP